MNKLLKSFIVLLLLTGQFHLSAHEYEDHADEQLCEVCITLKQQDQATEVPATGFSIQSSYNLLADKNLVAYSTQPLTYFSVRAPPSLS